MQSLWSRIAQVRGSCRCPQCLHTAHGVARRGTTAANAIRPKYWTSSTLWYSGVFAAAATFDASAKMRRREQWEEAIAGVKQELGQTGGVEGRQSGVEVVVEEELERGEMMVMRREDQDDVQTELSEQSLLPGDFHTPQGIGYTGGSLDTNFDAELAADLERNLDSTSRRLHEPSWPVNTGPQLIRHHLPPQSIYAATNSKRKAEARRWTEKKLKLVELSMERVILNFIIWLHENNDVLGYVELAARAVPTAFADKIRQTRAQAGKAHHLITTELERLQKTTAVPPGQPFDFTRDESTRPLCSYRQDDLGHFQDSQQDLNGSLQNLFHRGNDGDLAPPQYLAKIFYNLAVSDAPPNVDTYNTLIVGLAKGRHDFLTKQAIRSFRLTYMRPNEVSLAAILNFCTEIGDADQFHYWVTLMRGGRGGLMVANPGIIVNEASNGRIIEGAKPGKLIQLPYPTPMVMTALIRGVLNFSGFDAVLQVSKSLSPEGWGIDMQCLGILLRDCGDRGDWEAGHAVWKQILALAAKGSYWDAPRFKWYQQSVGWTRFADMLYLCFQCGQKAIFEDVMKLASESHSAGRVSQLIPNVKARREAAKKQAAHAERGSRRDSTAGVSTWEGPGELHSGWERDLAQDPEELTVDSMERPKSQQPNDSSGTLNSLEVTRSETADHLDEYVGKPMVLRLPTQPVIENESEPREDFDKHFGRPMILGLSAQQLAEANSAGYQEPSVTGHLDQEAESSSSMNVAEQEEMSQQSRQLDVDLAEELLSGRGCGPSDLDEYERDERATENH